MAKAYRWTFMAPARKLVYNMTVTDVSVLAALVVGGVTLINLLSDTLHLSGGFVGWIRSLDFDGPGYLLAALFATTW